jgi:hypothetical protein
MVAIIHAEGARRHSERTAFLAKPITYGRRLGFSTMAVDHGLPGRREPDFSLAF